MKVNQYFFELGLCLFMIESEQILIELPYENLILL